MSEATLSDVDAMDWKALFADMPEQELAMRQIQTYRTMRELIASVRLMRAMMNQHIMEVQQAAASHITLPEARQQVFWEAIQESIQHSCSVADRIDGAIKEIWPIRRPNL